MGRFGRAVAIGIRGTIVAGLVLAASALTAVPAFANPKYAGIVVDAKTGRTLYEHQADATRFPASLTKIMTLYILFEEIESGRMSMQTPLKVSAYAASRPPSKIGLKPGSTIRARDAALALITKSANDVAVVVAENISGSVPNFADRMTRTARALGMSRTTFRNPSGLPDKRQVTTARDMATLGRAIQQRFPKYYELFNTRVFTFNGRRFGNHNRLLGKVRGVDGIKTGYTRASGFNLVTNVETDGRHIVAVVIGGRTGASRNQQMTRLIGEYLPKASRGRYTAPSLVANVQTPDRRPASVALAEIPVPAVKPAAPVTLAAAAVPVPVAAAAVSVPVAAATPVPVPPRPVAGPEIVTGSIVRVPQKPDLKEALRRKTLAFAGADAPTPRAPDLAIRTVATQTIRVAPDEGVPLPDTPASASVTVATNNVSEPAPGWQVQIAAAESEDAAIAMLKRAKDAMGPALRGMEPHTEPVESGGATLYRARFVGFDSKTAAWNACTGLKRKRFNCFAVYQ